MPPARGPILGFRDFMRRSRVRGLYRDLLRCVPAADRHLVREGFRQHASEGVPAAINLHIAEAERQLALARQYNARAAAAAAVAPATGAAAPQWPWQRADKE